MSFFTKIKERLTRPKAGISLTFSKSSFTLGEDLKGMILVASEEEVDVREIKLKFECIESKKRTRLEQDRTGKQIERTYWDHAKLFSVSPKLSDYLHLSSGFRREFPFSINIPASGRESYHSMDAYVKWIIEAVMEVKGRRNVTSGEFEVSVVKPSEVTQIIKEKEIIREVVMIPCAYCGALMPQTSTFCPNCGARRKA